MSLQLNHLKNIHLFMFFAKIQDVFLFSSNIRPPMSCLFEPLGI